MSTTGGFGKPKYGSSGPQIKHYRLKEGSNVFRVLPPMKSLAEFGKWCLYYSVHYGYFGVNRADPSKPSYRTFRCIEDKNLRTGMIKQDCPECNKNGVQRKLLEAAQADLKQQGKSDEDIKISCAPLNGYLKSHNVDRKWYMNVLTEAGEVGVLEISHKCKKQLDAQIEKLQKEKGIKDPLDVDTGVWFDFLRTGNNKKVSEIVDTVSAVYEQVTIEGKKYDAIKQGPLTEEQVQKALTECPDLGQGMIRELTYTQIQNLVDISDAADPEAVDLILGISQQASAPASTPTPAPAPKPAAAKPTPAPAAAKPIPAAVAPAADSEEAVLEAQLAALRAKKAAAAAAAEAAAAEVPAPDELSDLSDDDFLNRITPGTASAPATK